MKKTKTDSPKSSPQPKGVAHKAIDNNGDIEKHLLSALLENVPDYIYFKDTESHFIRTSRAHAKAFGLDDPADVIGKSDFDFFSEEHARSA